MFDKMRDQELKAKWVAELRSGKWQQGRDELKTTERWDADRGIVVDLEAPNYCCLGVLREISGGAILENPDGSETLDPETSGLNETTQEQLAARNDGGRYWISANQDYKRFDPHTFAEIADWIEENL